MLLSYLLLLTGAGYPGLDTEDYCRRLVVKHPLAASLPAVTQVLFFNDVFTLKKNNFML
jgi:hypothetical protein